MARIYRYPIDNEIVQRIFSASREEVKKRWYVIFLVSQLGSTGKRRFNNREIAKKVGYCEHQVGRVLKAFKDHGPKAMEMTKSLDRPNAGRPKKLKEGELNLLAAALLGKLTLEWSTVQTTVWDIFKKEISESTARRRLQDLVDAQLIPERAVVKGQRRSSELNKPAETSSRVKEQTTKRKKTPLKESGDKAGIKDSADSRKQPHQLVADQAEASYTKVEQPRLIPL